MLPFNIILGTSAKSITFPLAWVILAGFPQEWPEKHESVRSGWETRCVFLGLDLWTELEGICVSPSSTAVSSSTCSPFFQQHWHLLLPTPAFLLPSLSLHPASTPGSSLRLHPSILPVSICSCTQPLSFLVVVDPSLSLCPLLFLCFCVYPRLLMPQGRASAALLSAPQLLQWLSHVPGIPLVLSALQNVSGALGINKTFRVCKLQLAEAYKPK